MFSTLEHALPAIAAWGIWILAAVVAGSLLLIGLLGQGRRWLIPDRWPGRLLSAGALLLAGLAALGLFCLLGPMRPMLAQVRSITRTVGKPAVDVDFRLVADRSPRRLNDLRGKVVLVNVWATWCPPCRRELPEINRLQRDYAGRDLVVLTLSNEDRELLRRFAGRYPFSTLNGYAPYLGWMDVPGRPMSFVIDRDGIVRECMVGARSYAEFKDKIDRWLPERS